MKSIEIQLENERMKSDLFQACWMAHARERELMVSRTVQSIHAEHCDVVTGGVQLRQPTLARPLRGGFRHCTRTVQGEAFGRNI